MNLASKYPIIYWNTACLSVDSSAINAADFYNLVDEDILSLDDEEKKKIANKMDYAKLAAALDKFKHVCTIKMPDINRSRLSFTPDVETNSILYGLKGICKVTDPAIEEIMMMRPFKSFADFLKNVTKKVVSKDKVINLIKCGAFDQLEGKDRREIMKEYITSTAELKTNVTMQNANMLIDFNLFPEEFEYECDVYKVTKELRRHRDQGKMWYIGDLVSVPYAKVNEWRQIIKDSNVLPQELVIDGEPHKVLDSSKWDIFYERNMSKLRAYLTAHKKELLDKMNECLFNEEWNKYCEGTNAQWELDSVNFYFDEHPLISVIKEMPEPVDNINNIVEGAQDGQFLIKGKVIPKMKLFNIAGTVIDKDKVKGLVTIQCPSGVVNIKIYKDLFATLNNTISTVNVAGEKEIIEDSFFEKGTHLYITGIQRGATFVPKVYKNTGHNAVRRIILDSEGHFKEFKEKEGN